MPAWWNLRGWALRAAISAVIATGMTIGAIGGTAEVLAEPPNLGPAPSALPEAIDAAVPAPPVKRLHRIPARSVTPGASHELQELREAVMPSPSGDRFFDQWPADLARRAAGDVIATRDVMRTAQLLMTVPLRSARQIKFRSVDAGDQPIFGTATLLVPAKAWKGPRSRPVLVHNYRRTRDEVHARLHACSRLSRRHQHHRPHPAVRSVGLGPRLRGDHA